MTKGPNRIVLDQYLDSAADGWVLSAGRDWKKKADDLQTLAEGLKQAAAQAELRIGEQTLTGPALRKSMEESSVSLTTKADQLRAAGEALRQVGQQISDTKDLRDNMADLGPRPSPYQAPANTTGVETTPEELAAQASASQARQAEISAWQSAYEKQEARSLTLTKQMDAAFLAAIPPMKEIHGQQDPTEPPPSAPSAPGGPYLPGTQAPPATGGGAGGGGGRGVAHIVGTELVQVGNENNNPNHTEINQPPIHVTTPPTTTPITTPTTVPTSLPTHTPTEVPSTSVGGTSQSGVAYQSPGSGISAPTTSGGSAGASAAALGAAGAAGGASAMTGGVRPGPLTSATGSSPVRAIGSTARAGAPGALSRAATAGSPTTATRSAGAAGGPASRGAAAGSTAGRGAAGGRGAATGAAGSSAGARSGGRGASGSRAAGAAGAAGRGGRKGDRDRATDRDRLVYDQDWLGDDDVAPGVLD